MSPILIASLRKRSARNSTLTIGAAKNLAGLVAPELARHGTRVRGSDPGNVAEETQAAAMQAMFNWYDAHSLLGTPLILRDIRSRKPRAVRAYFDELFAESQTAMTA